MGKGGQVERITTTNVGNWEGVWDRYRVAMEDGRICPVEHAELESGFHGGHQLAMDADEGIRVAVALARTGIKSVNARRYGFDPATVAGD